jgi:hypothetical protein
VTESSPDFSGNVRPIRAELFNEAAVGPALNSFGGGGTSGIMEALIGAKVAAAEARTDAKFAAVLTKLDSLTFEVRSNRSSIWTAAFAVMGLFLALVGILATVVPFSFTAGSQYRDIARDEVRLVEAQRPHAVPSIPAPAAQAPNSR